MIHPPPQTQRRDVKAFLESKGVMEIPPADSQGGKSRTSFLFQYPAHLENSLFADIND